MRFTRQILPLLVLAACAVIAWFFYTSREEPERRQPPPSTLRVDAIRLEKKSYPVILTSRGTVQPRTESTLIPEVSGTIVEVAPAFREGEFFEKGDRLLRIDPLNYEAAVTVAKGNLAQASAVLEEERARAEQALENWKELGNRGEPNSLVLRKPQLAEAEARIAAAEAQLRKAQRDLEKTEIRSPYAGRILDQNVDVGQYVSPGTVLARIYAVDYVEIRLPLSNTQLAFIDLPEKYRHGETAAEPNIPNLTLKGRIGDKSYSWEGTVVRVEGAIDQQSRQLFVVGHVNDPYARTRQGTPPLKIGLFVEAEIEGNVLHDVFVLPRNAVRAGSEIVLIDEDNRLQRTAIDPLWDDGEAVVVRAGDGLEEGQLVCTTPISFAANGVVVIPHVAGEAPPVTEARPDGPGSRAAGRRRPDSAADKGGPS